MPEIAGKIESCRGSHLAKGEFVVFLLASIESAGHRVVYLRNYENLPDDIGNDVDLLVERGHSYCILKIIKAFAPAWGWTIWKTVPSSCLSVYFLYDNKRGALHIDLFEHLEWHCVPFANAKGVLERRVWTGLVFKPSVPDELLVIPRPDVVITFVLPTNPGEAGQCELLGDHSLFVESELKCAPKIALRVTQENEVQLADEALRLLQAEPNFLLEENNWRC